MSESDGSGGACAFVMSGLPRVSCPGVPPEMMNHGFHGEEDCVGTKPNVLCRNNMSPRDLHFTRVTLGHIGTLKMFSGAGYMAGCISRIVMQKVSKRG